MNGFCIDKKIRLIELFAGVGSTAMALRDIGADFEHYRVIEFDKYAVKSYNAIHGTNFEPIDIKKVQGVDLGIEKCNEFTYLLTYLLLSMHRFVCRRKNGRYEPKRLGRWKGDKKRIIMGSREASERDGKSSAGSSYGECAAGSRLKEH